MTILYIVFRTFAVIYSDLFADAVGNVGLMTDITQIEIPASVKAIGYLAFNGCRNLKEVTMSKGTIFDKDTFPEGVNIRYRENEQEQSEPEEEEGFEPEI